MIRPITATASHAGTVISCVTREAAKATTATTARNRACPAALSRARPGSPLIQSTTFSRC